MRLIGCLAGLGRVEIAVETARQHDLIDMIMLWKKDGVMGGIKDERVTLEVTDDTGISVICLDFSTFGDFYARNKMPTATEFCCGLRQLCSHFC